MRSSSALIALGSTPGKNAAVDHRRRELRQRIVGMAGEQPRRHAAGAGQPDFALARLDKVGGLAVVGIGEPAPHRVAERALLELLAAREIGAGRLVQHRREAIGLDLVERMGEAVDRIVLARLGRMAAAVADGQRIAGEGLLGGLHGEAGGRPIGIERAAAAVGVETEFGMAEQVEPLGSRRSSRRCRWSPRRR